MKPLQERKEDFYQEVAKFANVYDRHILRAFYEYWTETNPNGRKMLFEMKKVFQLSKRLARWKYNDETKFGTQLKEEKPKQRRFPNHPDRLYERNLSPQETMQFHKHLRDIGWEAIRVPGQAIVWKEVVR